MSQTYENRVCSCDGWDQRVPLPLVDVAIQRPGVGHMVFGKHHAELRLKLTYNQTYSSSTFGEWILKFKSKQRKNKISFYSSHSIWSFSPFDYSRFQTWLSKNASFAVERVSWNRPELDVLDSTAYNQVLLMAVKLDIKNLPKDIKK